MTIKKISGVLLSVLLATFLSTRAFADEVPLDGIAATVNDAIITQSQLDEQVSSFEKKLGQEGKTLPSREKIRIQVLQYMISNKLQLQLAKRLGIEIDDDTLNNTIKRVAKNNHLTLVQLRQSLIQSGYDYRLYRKDLRDQLTIEKLQAQEVGREIKITQQEITDEVKQLKAKNHQSAEFHLMNIVIPLSPEPTTEELTKAKAKAITLIEKAKAGADFQKLALAESGGHHALQGGDLGWRKRDVLPSLFADAVQGKQAGDLIGPLRAGNGFHIVKIAGIRQKKATQATPKEARKILFSRKYEESLTLWLKQLRAQAYIKIWHQNA